MSVLPWEILRIRLLAASALVLTVGAAGETVVLEKKPTPPSTSASLFSLSYTRHESPWAASRLWTTGEDGVLFLSLDQGRSWWGSEGPAGNWLLDIAFADVDHGWAVGTAGTVLYTDQAGLTWVQRGPQVQENFHAVWVSGTEVWVGGSDGMILYTSDAGTTWQTLRREHDGVIRRFFFLESDGWAVGDHGMILHSPDHGTTWRKLAGKASPTLVNLVGIHFLDPCQGYAWGDFGTVLRTDDGGERWQELRVGVTQSIRELFFPANADPIALTRHGVLFLDPPETWPAAVGAEAAVPLSRQVLVWDDGVFHRGVALGDDGSLLIAGSHGLLARLEQPAEAGADGGLQRLHVHNLLGRGPETDTGHRSRAEGLVDEAGTFLGARYRRDPLGEGQDGEVDNDPRSSAEAFDCVTLIEQAIALELSASESEDMLPFLDRIRYRAGRVSFTSRNHFFVTDWISNNSWLVEDITSSIGPSAARRVTRTIGREAFFQSRGLREPAVQDEERSTYILPVADVFRLADRLETGMLVVIVGKEEWLFAQHTGILLRVKAGSRLLLRHASGSAGRVVDEDFLRYLQRRSHSIEGIKLLRMVE